MRIDQSYSTEEQPSLSRIRISSSRNRSVETSSIRLPFFTFVRPPVRHTDIISHHFTSSRRISFHFYVIRDVFSFIFTSFFSFRPHCTLNPKLTRSFISFIFQIWLNHLLGGQTTIKFFRCFGTDQYNALALPFQSTFVDFISKSD